MQNKTVIVIDETCYGDNSLFPDKEDARSNIIAHQKISKSMRFFISGHQLNFCNFAA